MYNLKIYKLCNIYIYIYIYIYTYIYDTFIILPFFFLMYIKIMKRKLWKYKGFANLYETQNVQCKNMYKT